MKWLLCGVLVLLASLTALAAPVTLTQGVFDVTFYNAGDTNGYTAGQQDWTAEQMADVAASIDAWSGRIANTPGRQVQMHVFWEEMNASGTHVLGGSTSYVMSDNITQSNLGEYVWKTGIDPGLTAYGFDTIIRYDITAGGLDWNFGQDAPAADQIDFRSVLTHELGHSLGFTTSYDFSFDDWGWYFSRYGGITDWDRNLVDSNGNKALNGTTGTPGNFNEYDNPVYWDGPAATALFGGPVPIYAPPAWAAGLSLSHLDETLLSEYLMSPVVDPGIVSRTVSPLEWAMMSDMGWTIIPEPATLLLLGLGGLVLTQKKLIRGA